MVRGVGLDWIVKLYFWSRRWRVRVRRRSGCLDGICLHSRFCLWLHILYRTVHTYVYIYIHTYAQIHSNLIMYILVRLLNQSEDCGVGEKGPFSEF